MSYTVRGDTPVLGGGTSIEVQNGMNAPFTGLIQLVEVMPFNSAAAPSAGSTVLFIVPPAASGATGALPLGGYRFVGASATWTVASTSGTLQVVHDTGVSAPGSGTALLASALSLSTTANTVVSAFPSASVSAANQLLSPGDRLSITFGGTLTNLANLAINIFVSRVA